MTPMKIRRQGGNGEVGENSPYVWKHRPTTPSGPLPCSASDIVTCWMTRQKSTTDHCTCLADVLGKIWIQELNRKKDKPYRIVYNYIVVANDWAGAVLQKPSFIWYHIKEKNSNYGSFFFALSFLFLDSQTYRQTDIQTDRQTDRRTQTDSKTDWQT